MLVLKFGGTSLGNAERIKSVAKIVSAQNNCKDALQALHSTLKNKTVNREKSWIQLQA